jgi:RNA polymerase sigma-70 factor (ECF subfamily)
MAEDAAQEALLAAYRGITRLKKPDRFAGWLTSICRNIAIDMVRARARQERVESADCGPVRIASRHESDTVAVVRELISGLEPDLREVIYLRYYSRMSYVRIARALGISEEAVNGRLRRARDRIRRQLPRRMSTEIDS